MDWRVDYTDKFGDWWQTLDEEQQKAIAHDIQVLRTIGTGLGRPQVDTVKQSKFSDMRELRTQCRGEPFRVLFAFDPRRCAILLIGGNKAGDKRWYERFVRIADDLYSEHLDELKRKGLI